MEIGSGLLIFKPTIQYFLTCSTPIIKIYVINEMEIFWYNLPSTVLFALFLISTIRADVINLSEELEEDGYFRKEHSLTKPYTGVCENFCSVHHRHEVI